MINIVMAYGKCHVIDREGETPLFRRITQGHPIIMGRKTHEFIGKLLPNRKNIIVTSQEGYIPCDVSDTCIVTSDLNTAIEAALREDEEIFIIGGAEICKQAEPLSDRMYISLGDSSFPTYLDDWRLVSKIQYQEFISCIFERT